MEIAGNYRDKTPHIVEHLDNRIRILFVRESTSGVGEGQMTAMAWDDAKEKKDVSA